MPRGSRCARPDPPWDKHFKTVAHYSTRNHSALRYAVSGQLSATG